MSPWKSTSFLYWFLGAGKPWISHIASGSRLLFPGFHFWDGLGNNIGKSKDMWKCMQMYLSNKQCCIYIYIYIYNVHIYNMFIYFIHIDFLHITNNSGLWGSWKPRNTCPAISFHQRTLKEKTKARDLLHLVAFKFQPLLSTRWHSAPWNGQFSCSISDLRWGWPQIWRVSALTVIPVTSMTYNYLPTIKSIIYIYT